MKFLIAASVVAAAMLMFTGGTSATLTEGELDLVQKLTRVAKEQLAADKEKYDKVKEQLNFVLAAKKDLKQEVEKLTKAMNGEKPDKKLLGRLKQLKESENDLNQLSSELAALDDSMKRLQTILNDHQDVINEMQNLQP